MLDSLSIFLLVTGFCTVLRRGGSLAIKARLYFDLVLAGILLAFHCLEDGCRVRWELLPYALRLWEGLETTESCGDPEEICRVTAKGNMINILDLPVSFIFAITYLN